MLSLGEGATIDLLKTWRNPGKPISDMSAKSLTSQQDRPQTYNLANAPRFAAGKAISKQTLAEFRSVGVGKFSDLLICLWGKVKFEFPVCEKIELAFLPQTRMRLAYYLKII